MLVTDAPDDVDTTGAIRQAAAVAAAAVAATVAEALAEVTVTEVVASEKADAYFVRFRRRPPSA